MNKKMLVLSVFLGLAALFPSLVCASGDLQNVWQYTTTQSTGVVISTRTPIILRSVFLSTFGVVNSYALIVDTNPLATASTGAAGGFVAPSSYPRSQWVSPQLMFTSTGNAIASTYVGAAWYPGGEEGIALANGLIVAQSDVGGTVTVIWRRPKE